MMRKREATICRASGGLELLLRARVMMARRAKLVPPAKSGVVVSILSWKGDRGG